MSDSKVGSQVGKTRLEGHALFGEGRPVSWVKDSEHRSVHHIGLKTAYVDYNALRPSGRALCECGAESPVLPSTAARKRWHREHKDAIRAEQWHREHPDELGIER